MSALPAQIRSRVAIEARQYVRRTEAVFFGFVLPPLLLVLFASVFGGRAAGTNVPFAQYFLAGIVGAIGLNLGFATLAGSLATDRGTGALARLATTPMSPIVYVVAKVIVLLAATAAQLVTLLALGRLAFGLRLPNGHGWITLTWVLTLSVVCFSVLGVAWSVLIKDPESATAVISPVIVVMPFVSGVYFVFGDLPGWMRAIGSAFPLRWATLGMRAAFLPDRFQAAEPGGSWHLLVVAALLIGWTVAGGAISARTFRWRTDG